MAARRVLIFTASVGEGHDLPARTLTNQICLEYPGTEVVVEDGLRAMGPFWVLASEGGAGVVFHRFQWVWDATFWLFVHFRPGRRVTQRLVWRGGSRGVLRVIEHVNPDVIVSVYPITTEVLGRLRRQGQLNIPVCAAITDLAMMHFWAAPGIDLHLITHAESEPEVRQVAGHDTQVVVVHGLTRPEFVEPRASGDARQSLGLPKKGKVVLVSGGGWGVGDLTGAVNAALGFEDVSAIVCLCGRNEELHARLAERFGDEPRVRLERFTDEIPDWLAASDALVHSTGGLTVLEANMRGCPTISYGWGRGHIRANNTAFTRHGMAEVVSSKRDLNAALTRAFGRPRKADLSFADLPSAASAVVALLTAS